MEKERKKIKQNLELLRKNSEMFCIQKAILDAR